jgi:hypothetical protein
VIVKASITKRMIVPALPVMIMMLVSWFAYEYAWRIDSAVIHRGLAFAAGILLFAVIAFGPMLVYPMAYFRGAVVGERILACMITPIFWNVKEVVRVTEYFTVGESLYYGLNPLFLGLLAVVLFQIGLAEIICRRRLQKRDKISLLVFRPAAVVAMVVGAAGVFIFNLWGMGVHWFYVYQEGYNALFH